VTGLLPRAIHEGVAQKSVVSASTSFGLVAFVVLVVLLVEWDVLRTRSWPPRVFGFGAVVLSLLATVALTIAARLARLAP
jgi:hypothetical protein